MQKVSVKMILILALITVTAATVWVSGSAAMAVKVESSTGTPVDENNVGVDDTAVLEGKQFAEVFFNYINILLDGKVVAERGEIFTLDSGMVLPYSILYEGTTYLPMRKLAEILGMEVLYDADTKTASINKSEKTQETQIVYKESTDMYEEFPSLPDFGLFSGSKLDFVNKTDASTNYLYEDITDPIKIVTYVKMLEELGYNMLEPFDNDEGNIVLMMISSEHILFLSYMYDVFSIIII